MHQAPLLPDLTLLFTIPEFQAKLTVCGTFIQLPMFRTTEDIFIALKRNAISAIRFCCWHYKRRAPRTPPVVGTPDVVEISQDRIAGDGCTRLANDSFNSFFDDFFEIRLIFVLFMSLQQRNPASNPSPDRIDFVIHFLEQSALESVVGFLTQPHLHADNACTHGLMM